MQCPQQCCGFASSGRIPGLISGWAGHGERVSEWWLSLGAKQDNYQSVHYASKQGTGWQDPATEANLTETSWSSTALVTAWRKDEWDLHPDPWSTEGPGSLSGSHAFLILLPQLGARLSQGGVWGEQRETWSRGAWENRGSRNA